MKPYFAKLIEGKLFLCSRDIQVGDNVKADYWIDKGGQLESHFMKEGEVIGYDQKMEHWIIKRPDDLFPGRFVKEYSLKTETFKVIGEISKEATWVTEGMEFGDSDVYIYKPLEFDHYETYFDTELQAEAERPVYKDRIEVQIKGPCGHFH